MSITFSILNVQIITCFFTPDVQYPKMSKFGHSFEKFELFIQLWTSLRILNLYLFNSFHPKFGVTLHYVQNKIKLIYFNKSIIMIIIFRNYKKL